MFSADSSTRTISTTSEIIYPKWYKSLETTPRNIAILPFSGYGSKAESVARQFESKFRAKLIEGKTYRLLERGQIEKILHEQRFQLSGLTLESATRIGNMLGADLLILGEIPQYYEEETYIDYVEGLNQAGDEYERKVTLNLAMRIISVESGEIVFEHNKTYMKSKSGYKNVRRIEKKEAEYGNKTLDALSTLTSAISDLDITFSDGVGAYGEMRNACINSAVSQCLVDVLPYKKKFKETYVIDSSGKQNVISKDEIGNEYGIVGTPRRSSGNPNRVYRMPSEPKSSSSKEQKNTRSLTKSQRMSMKYYSFGNEYYKNKSYRDAAYNFEKLIEINPNYRDVKLQLGNTYFQMGTYEKAKQQYLSIRHGDQSYSDAIIGIGNIYLHKGALEGAERKYKEALRVDPKSWKAWEGMGMVAEKRGDKQQQWYAQTRAAEIRRSSQ